jgi:ABC-type sugar transport system ATPase subunit
MTSFDSGTHLSLSGITRRFAGVTALDGVDLAVRRGELCVIVGPSGCGKSTLLRTIAGLEPLDAGTVRLAGRDVTRLTPRDRDVAFVFQSYALYPHLTVRGNLEFPLRVRGVAADERARRAEEAAELLGIDELLDRKPAQLSGGQRQRVAMGRAVVRKPALFLFDEPLSNLDARLRVHMRVELVELHRRLGVTTVYVTHDQAEAMTLGERVAVMRSGRVLQVGAPREVYDRPLDTFVAGFFGSPPMNLFDGEVVPGGEARTFRCAAGSVPAPTWLAEGLATLGVRPDDVALRDGGVLSMRVRVVEDLGADRFAYGAAGHREVVVRLDRGEADPPTGETVKLAPRPEALHWFVDGRRVEPQRGSS